MKSTLEILNKLIDESTLGMTLEEISMEYKKDLSPSLLALAFKKVYKLIISVSSDYIGLATEDVASLSLEKLDECLQQFLPESGVKFTTFYTVYLKNRFREETQHLNTHKRKVLFVSDSYEEMTDNGYEPVDESVEDSIQSVLDTLIMFNLSDKELRYCVMVIEGYTNNEISKILGVSLMTLTNFRKKLKKKLSVLL